MSYLELVKWLVWGEVTKYTLIAAGMGVVMIAVYIWWRRHGG